MRKCLEAKCNKMRDDSRIFHHSCDITQQACSYCFLFDPEYIKLHPDIMVFVRKRCSEHQIADISLLQPRQLFTLNLNSYHCDNIATQIHIFIIFLTVTQSNTSPISKKWTLKVKETANNKLYCVFYLFCSQSER